MRYLVTASEMRRYDANTIERIGIPGMVLMERAALAARERVLAFCDASNTKVLNSGNDCQVYGEGYQKKRVLVLVGMGNNGGDGLALARLLAELGIEVEVWCVGNIQKASAQWVMQQQILKAYDVIWSEAPRYLEYTVLVDALFGVGLSREVEGEYRQAIESFNKLNGHKIALDIPSGICSDSGKILGCAVCADETVTFAFAKRGLYLYPGCQMTGEITVSDIGITKRAFYDAAPGMFCLEDEREWLPKRTQEGNKGTFGKVLVVAGCKGMAGAAVLCARAAYRSGAGMVKVITDESNREILQSCLPEAMYGTYEDVQQGLEWADVVVIGPGLGRLKKSSEVFRQVITYRNDDKPLILDADALNLLAEDKELYGPISEQVNRSVILTPHVGELGRLTGKTTEELKDNLWEHGRELAQCLHAVVVTKDARTFVCCEGLPVCVNIYGNSGMATAGSGDVLAGMIAGVVAQYSRQKYPGNPAFRAACAAVRLHAAAGDLVAKEKGEYACMAGDIAEAASFVTSEHKKKFE